MKSLLPVLYFGAIIAPFAAALMYCSSAARSLYGMSRNGYIPAFFQQLSGYGNPLYAIVANFTFSLLLFAPLPGWHKMVNFLSSLLAITYSVGPISLLALRYQAPDYNRPLKLPFGRFWSFLAFYICTLLAYWSGWNTISKMGIAIGIGLLVFYTCRLYTDNGRQDLNISSSRWMWVYLCGIMFFSWIGNFGGGLGMIPQPYMLCLLAIFCSISLWLALRYKLEPALTKSYINNLKLSVTAPASSGQPVIVSQGQSQFMQPIKDGH
jgi:amino acid transporter